MNIGKRIVIARTNAGLTQAELAKRMDIPYQTIGHWERNMSSPKFSSLERLADALGINVETLICGQAAGEQPAKENIKKRLTAPKTSKYLIILKESLRKTMAAKTSLDLYLTLCNMDKMSDEAKILNKISARLSDDIIDMVNLCIDAHTQQQEDKTRDTE